VTPASFTPDDPVWTAYALGEVSPKEKPGLDAALRFSPEGEAQVEKLRLAAQNLREAWTAEKVEVIPLDAAPFVDDALAEAGYGGANASAGGGWNLGFGTFSPKYVVVGFAVIVAAVGGTAWELHQDPRPALLRWIPPMGVESGAAPSAAPAMATTTTVETLPAPAPAAMAPPPPLADNAFEVRSAEPEAAVPPAAPAAAPAPSPAPAPAKAPQPASVPVPVLGGPSLVPASPADAPTPAPAPAPSPSPSATTSDDAERAARKERLDRLREQLAQQPPAPASPAAPASLAPAAFPDAVAAAPILTETEVPLTTTAPGSLTFVPGPLRTVAQPVVTGFALPEVVPVISAVVLAPKERTADGASVEEGGGVRLVDYGSESDALRVPVPAPFVMLARLYPSPWVQDGSRQLLVVALRPTTPAQVARPPATLVFLVDNSLSMGAPDRLGAFKKAVAPFLERLQPGDRVGIVTYAGSSSIALPLTEIPKKAAKGPGGNGGPAPLVSAPVAGSDGTPSEAEARAAIRSAFAKLAVVAADRPGASLRAAFDMARKGEQPDGYNRVIVVTDGDLPSLAYGQAPADGGMAGEIGRQARNGITTSVMFLGREAADGALLRQVVAAGKGRGSVLRTAGGVETVLDRELVPPRPATAKDVKLQLALAPEAVGAWRLIGYENSFPVTGNGIAPKEGDGLLAFYELQRPATAAPVDLTARYRLASDGAPGKETLRVGGIGSEGAPLASADVAPQVMKSFEKDASEVRDRLAALSPDTRPGVGSRSGGSAAQDSAPNGSGATPDEAYKNFRQNAEEWLDGAKR